MLVFFRPSNTKLIYLEDVKPHTLCLFLLLCSLSAICLQLCLSPSLRASGAHKHGRVYVLFYLFSCVEGVVVCVSGYIYIYVCIVSAVHFIIICVVCALQRISHSRLHYKTVFSSLYPYLLNFQALKFMPSHVSNPNGNKDPLKSLR